MRCEVCYKEARKGTILRTKSRVIFVCHECQNFVVKDGVLVQGEVMVVPVKSSSLERAIKQKVYIRPWAKKGRHGIFIAFYHQGVISYIGKIAQIHRKVPRKSIKHMLSLKEDWERKMFYTIYELEYVDELERPLIRGNCPPVQGKLLVPFNKFASAKDVCDLR